MTYGTKPIQALRFLLQNSDASSWGQGTSYILINTPNNIQSSLRRLLRYTNSKYQIISIDTDLGTTLIWDHLNDAANIRLSIPQTLQAITFYSQKNLFIWEPEESRDAKVIRSKGYIYKL